MVLNGVSGLVRSCTAASEAEDASEILFTADKTMLDFAWLRFLRGLSRLLCQVPRRSLQRAHGGFRFLMLISVMHGLI